MFPKQSRVSQQSRAQGFNCTSAVKHSGQTFRTISASWSGYIEESFTRYHGITSEQIPSLLQDLKMSVAQIRDHIERETDTEVTRKIHSRVERNKIKKMSSFKSNENIHKKEDGSYYVVSANKASSVTLL